MNDGQDLIAALIPFLSTVSLFAGLDDVSLRAIAEQMEPVGVSAGSLLIEEGEPADCLYILSVGRLRVTAHVEEEERFLRELSPGAVVGEMALLTDEPRTATVRAVRDSEVLRLRATSFSGLVEQYPVVLRQISKLLVNRLVDVNGPPPSSRPLTIVVAPAGATRGPFGAVAAALAAEMMRHGRIILLDARTVERALGEGAAGRRPGDAGWGELARWLSAAERDHDQIIYETDELPTPWTRTCLRQADLLLLVGARGTDPAPSEIETLIASSPEIVARRELVLAERPGADSAHPTASWLDRRDVAEHHHLREGSVDDVARLARIVRGEACAIVLSGGGPRGLAHLGVLRALEEAHVPFDYLAGTSIGAVMAALAAHGFSHDERMDRIKRLTTRRGVLDLTLPIIALATGRRVNRMLEGTFGSTRIEDLPRSFLCVSADLVSADEVIHDRGELWRALRASLSLPGIFPPVPGVANLLVDGATLNNLPVDVMRDRLPAGWVVAVDLFPGIGPFTRTPGEPAVSGWRELGRRVRHPARYQGPPPLGIFDVLSRANALSGVRWQRSTVSGHRIDLHLRPPLPVVGAFDFKSALPFVDLGYRYALESLETTAFAARFV